MFVCAKRWEAVIMAAGVTIAIVGMTRVSAQEEVPAPPADPAPPAVPAVPGDQEALPLPGDPVPPAGPGALPPGPPADSFSAPPPPAREYEEPRYSTRPQRPTIELSTVIEEPVSIHEARGLVLSGNMCASLAALDTLASRYPADARVAYLRYFLLARTGQREVALASLERAVAIEYLYPVNDYARFMEPIQGADRYYAERVRRTVRDLDTRGVLIPPVESEVIVAPPAPEQTPPRPPAPGAVPPGQPGTLVPEDAVPETMEDAPEATEEAPAPVEPPVPQEDAAPEPVEEAPAA